MYKRQVFVFGILTIRGHSSNIGYKSKWFLPQTTKEYSFDVYKRDIQEMTDEDIIENMAAELYKLNDINRQKLRTNRWVIRSFSSTLITASIIYILIVASVLSVSYTHLVRKKTQIAHDILLFSG